MPSHRNGTGKYLAFAIPFVAALGLGALLMTPRVSASGRLTGSFLAAAALLLVWGAVLAVRAVRNGQTPEIELVVRRAHWVQALVLLAVYLYWGWYWRPVYEYATLLLAQVLFAYGFDALLSWSRGRRAGLGLGPLVVVGVMNLFLWFGDEWFILQFGMVALAYLSKAFLRWERDGKRAHIFNPAAFALAAVSLFLIAAGASDLTRGAEMAATLFRPPHIYLMIFLLGFVVQAILGATSMTLAAAATVYGFGLLYAWLTGTHFFIDSTIPIAVFVGMHLLITDLSTSPKTNLGRWVFGALYGISVLAFYALLELFYVPSFYDVFMGVPLINLSVKALDRWARSIGWARRSEGRPLLKGLSTYHNLFELLVWAGLFAIMSSTGAIGDEHEGGNLAFWREACAQDRFRACAVRERFELRLCEQGSGWACNERGAEIALDDADSRKRAAELFGRGCILGYDPACGNEKIAQSATPDASTIVKGRPDEPDWVYLLQDGSKGPLPPMNMQDLFTRSCDKGWVEGCTTLGVLYTSGLDGVERDLLEAADALTKACDMGHAESCATLAVWYDQGGEGFLPNPTRALDMMQRACDLGTREACAAMESANRGQRIHGREVGWELPAAVN